MSPDGLNSRNTGFWHSNGVTNTLAGLALIVAAASLFQSSANSRLLTRPRYEATAEFSLRKGRVFDVRECAREPKAKTRVHVSIVNTGHSAFSLYKLSLEQSESSQPYFDPIKSGILQLTTGKTIQLPHKLESGDSLSVILPATFFIAPSTCYRAREEPGFLYKARSFVMMDLENSKEIDIEEINENALPTLGKPLRVVYRVVNDRAERSITVPLDGYTP